MDELSLKLQISPRNVTNPIKLIKTSSQLTKFDFDSTLKNIYTTICCRIFIIKIPRVVMTMQIQEQRFPSLHAK